MREIAFRGKRIDNGEWVQGSLVLYKNGTAAIYCEELNEHFPIPVIPETVGQFTGLIDCKQNRIFEGDIAEQRPSNSFGKTLIAIDVVFRHGRWGVWAKVPDGKEKDGSIKWVKVFRCLCEYYCNAYNNTSELKTELEVIGNIHDRKYSGGQNESERN